MAEERQPLFVGVDTVIFDLGVSRAKAYDVIKQLNKELKKENPRAITISKCKTLLKEQAQVIAQKDLKIVQMEKSLREKDEAYARLLQQKAEQKERLEQKVESERSSYRYLNSRLRETEEELDKERGKSGWDKFREKHRLKIWKRRYKRYYQTRKRFADWFVEKMLFPLGCVIFVVVVSAILIHFDLVYVVNKGLSLVSNLLERAFF
ncbi:MAG: hypothetical protein SO445_05825 [Lachnospiraceae bacterium]|nr:hypothetical protein [Lachnospiraceae bacterium]MDD7377515.1 hypothetical protein [Lachnospiraceae bacterium]MDY4617212.1 hypothetical protein [Lachnospiraceae bacterium]